MSLFSKLLNDNTDTSCILLCGSCIDQIISSDLCLREFSVALTDILHEHGFDNVVFFDCTNAMGEYVYDDKSAQYCFPSNSGASVTSGTIGTGPSGNRLRFGRPRTPATSTAGINPMPAAPQTTDPIYQRKNMAEESFYGDCQKMMTGTAYRSAIIFTDINNLIQRNTTIGQYAESIRQSWRGRNLMIFLHPDSNGQESNALYPGLQQLDLLSYFYEVENNKVYKPRPNRVFKIRCFGKDEIKNLLLRHKILSGLCFPDGIETAVDKLAYAIRSINAEGSREEITIRSLNSRIANQITSGSTVFDDQFMQRVLGHDMRQFDFNPWETLEKRRGWEEITKQLKTLLTGIEKPSVQPEHRRASLLVERIGGDEAKPSLPSSKLPHLMLEGNPGTGKTTIIRSLGRIMHDEGILTIGHVVTAKKSDLIADVIGGTAIKVQHLLDQAENGILFIDEAYALCDDFNRDGNANVFANEAVTALVQAMTDDDRHVLIAFAGYYCSDPNATDGVRGLFKMNNGLESRIRRIISIPDYTPNILTDIFLDILYEHGFSLSNELTRENIQNYMENVYQSRDRKTFANGRFVKESLIESELIPRANNRGSTQITRSDFDADASKLDKPSLDAVLREMDAYPVIGEKVKEIVTDCSYRHEMHSAEGGLHGSKSVLPHMILYGNRGTGKNTLVQLLHKALSAANMISNTLPIQIPNPEIISLSDLERKIKDAVNSNTFLYIQNAQNCSADVLNSVCRGIENSSELICIFSVYESKREEFKEKCVELIGSCREFTIQEYTPDQLMAIYESLLSKEEWRCSDACKENLKILFENWYSNRSTKEGYANAKSVVDLFNQMKEMHFRRTGNVRAEITDQDMPEEYANIIASMSHTRSIDDICNEINQYTGWNDLKERIENIYQHIIYNQNHPEASLPLPTGHLVFVGSPGTGKTTAAKLYADACYAMGVITSNKFVPCTARDLIAGYVGQTQERTARLLESGRNGVIFIDEAYSLAYNEADGTAGSFKEDAVNELLAFMEKERDTTILIFAGYEGPISEFLDSNEGLRSRISQTIHFPNFEADQCKDILEGMLRKRILRIDDNALDDVDGIFDEYRKDPNFSNARDVRNIADRIIRAHVSRCVNNSDASEQSISITLDDVQNGFKSWESERGCR